MRIRPVLSIVFAILITALAIWFLAQAFATTTWADVQTAIVLQPVGCIAESVLLTGLSYVAFASFEVFAARLVAPDRLGIGVPALAGATSNAIAATLGFQAATATAVRLRIYRIAGVGLADIARITVLATWALAMGFVAVLALAFIAAPSPDAPGIYRALGAALVVGLAVYIWWLSRADGQVKIGRLALALPSARLGLIQIVIATVEMAATTGALYVLLPADLLPSFGTFCAGVVGATLLGIGSQTPGGLGVFEASMTALLGGAGRPDLLAGLLVYRLINNLLPFTLAAAALASFELWHAARAGRDAR